MRSSSHQRTDLRQFVKLLSKIIGTISKSLYITKYIYHLHSMLIINCSNQQCRRESVIITFWAHLARTFDAEYVHTLPPPALAVFTSLKMATYKGTYCPRLSHTHTINHKQLQFILCYTNRKDNPNRHRPHMCNLQSRNPTNITISSRVSFILQVQSYAFLFFHIFFYYS